MSVRDLYYFPERLKRQLSGINSFPLTIVEAPSGFGKTTAVREYLKGNRKSGDRENWYTCLGEPPSKAWEGLCGLFGDVDVDVAVALKELGPPTMETLADVAALARKVRVQAETFLVFDNYQLFDNEISREIMDAFSVHASDKLHMIFITQPLPVSRQSVYNANIHRLRNMDLFFDRDSTARFFRLLGIKLPEKELDYIQKVSEGWMAIIRLQAENYRETNSFAHINDMDGLIETAIWNRLAQDERDFLASVSLLESFTPRQAAVMSGRILSDKIGNLLKNNPFIPYDESKGVYYMHSILGNFLRKVFERDKSDDFRAAMFHRAGNACSLIGDYFRAASFYREAKDFPAIFSLPFTSRYLNSQKEAGIMKFIAEILSECPDEMLAERPFVAIALAFQFLISGMKAEFGRLLEVIQRLVRDPMGVPLGDMERIKGELALLTSFTHFNDIERMSSFHKEALEHFGGKPEPAQSTITFGRTPWTFGITSVLYLYWSKRGELEKELCSMAECIPYYMKLSGGHGTGAESVMRAEALLLRGCDVESEILCHRALYTAQSQKQESICLCAELILARIAVLRGDCEGYSASLGSIRRYADEAHKRKPTTRMVEMCLAATSLSLGIPDGVADWLCDADRIRETLYMQGLPYGHILYGGYLVRTQRWSKVFGLSDAVSGMTGGIDYLLPQVYWNIYMAVAGQCMKKNADESRRYLALALALALPDRVYLPFAEYGAFILPMLCTVKGDFDDERVDALISLCRRQISGADAVRKALSGGKAVLTPRQREIALLMREGLSAKEIALELFIAESTVTSARKIIYDKLNIHSKIELTKIEL